MHEIINTYLLQRWHFLLYLLPKNTLIVEYRNFSPISYNIMLYFIIIVYYDNKRREGKSMRKITTWKPRCLKFFSSSATLYITHTDGIHCNNYFRTVLFSSLRALISFIPYLSIVLWFFYFTQRVTFFLIGLLYSLHRKKHKITFLY